MGVMLNTQGEPRDGEIGSDDGSHLPGNSETWQL